MGRFSDDDYDLMATRREAGNSCEAIAALIRATGKECSAEVVNWHCLRLGADPPNARPLPQTCPGPVAMQRGDHVVRRFSKEEDERLTALAKTIPTISDYQIGRLMGRKPNSVRGRLMTLARHEARREQNG